MRYLCILGLLALASCAYAVPPGGVIWDNGAFDYQNGLCDQRVGAVQLCDEADDFHTTQVWTITGAIWESVDDYTYAWDGTDDMVIYNWTANGPGTEFKRLFNVPNEREQLGTQWSRPWYRYTIDLTASGNQFNLPAGDYFVLLRPYTPGTAGQSFWCTAAGNGQQGYFRSDYFGYPNWTANANVFGTPYETCFKLYGVPEPGLVSLAGLLLGAGALWLRRK